MSTGMNWNNSSSRQHPPPQDAAADCPAWIFGGGEKVTIPPEHIREAEARANEGNCPDWVGKPNGYVDLIGGMEDKNGETGLTAAALAGNPLHVGRTSIASAALDVAGSFVARGLGMLGW